MHHEMKEVGALLFSIQFYVGCARKKDPVPECAGSQRKEKQLEKLSCRTGRIELRN